MIYQDPHTLSDTMEGSHDLHLYSPIRLSTGRVMTPPFYAEIVKEIDGTISKLEVNDIALSTEEYKELCWELKKRRAGKHWL